MECYTKKDGAVKVCGYFTGTPSEKDYGFQFFVKGGTAPTPDPTPDPKPDPEPTPDPKPTNEYVLTNELKDGDEVVIYNPGYGKAVKNETDNNWYLIAQDVTPADNKITTDDTTIVWTVKKNEDGTFSFVNGDNAVTAWYSSNDKGEFLELTNDANYEGGDSKWNLTAANATEKTFYISSATLTGAKGAGYMECYTKKNGVKVCGFFTDKPSEKDYGFQFFVKGGTTPDPEPTPDPKPDPEPTPDPKPSGTYAAANSISVGDTIVITATVSGKNYELDGFYSTGTATLGQTAEFTTNVAATLALEVVAGKTDGTYAFKTKDNKYLSWTKGNSLTTSSELNENASWVVTFNDNGTAKIVNATTAASEANDQRVIVFNLNATGKPRFAAYTKYDDKVKTESQYGVPVIYKLG